MQTTGCNPYVILICKKNIRQSFEATFSIAHMLSQCGSTRLVAAQASNLVLTQLVRNRTRRRFVCSEQATFDGGPARSLSSIPRSLPGQPDSAVQTAGSGQGESSSQGVHLLAPSERALGRLAALLVHKGGLCAGDVYCLYGEVGAGKSVFSRAFIRTAARDPSLTVPSPTYLLQVGSDLWLAVLVRVRK